MTDVELAREEWLETFQCVLLQARHFEALQALKPVLVRLVDRDLLSPALLSSFWKIVTEQYTTWSQKAYDLFCDVVLKMKDSHPVFDVIGLEPPLDIYRRLIAGPQFAKLAAQKLLDKGALEELTKAAASGDLRFLVPELTASLSETDKLESALCVINAIFDHLPSDYSTSDIVHAVALRLDAVTNVPAVIHALAHILKKTSSSVLASDFELLFEKSGENAITLVRDLIPGDRKPFIPDASFAFLAKEVSQIAARPDGLPILEHIYLSVDSAGDLAATLRDALWNIMFAAADESQRKATSKLILTFRDNKSLPRTLMRYVELCLDRLLEEESGNAAVFICDCLEVAASYVNILFLGFVPHRFDLPEDNVEVSVSLNGEIVRLPFNRYQTVAHFLPFLSGNLGHPIDSMVLYQNNSVLKTDALLNSSDVIEIRLKRHFIAPPPFTADCHPIAPLRSGKYITRLFELLDSPIGEQVYQILIQIPTPDGYKLEDLSDVDPSRRFFFIYKNQYKPQPLHEK
jgi:hypothetical protein